MVANSKDSAQLLADLSPVDIFAFATETNRGVYADPFRRHKTLVAARIAAAQNRNPTKLYEFDFDTEQWNEIK